MAILVSNQRRTPSRWSLMALAASIVGARVWVAQKIPLLEEVFGGLAARLGVEVLEGKPDLIGAGGLEGEVREPAEGVLLGRGERIVGRARASST